MESAHATNSALRFYPRAEFPKQTAGNAFGDFLHMTDLQGEITLFAARRDRERDNARQNAAFFIISGIDLPLALKSAGEARRRIILRVERLLERERLKGMRRHWSYDLNRHIALKEAFDRLRGIEKENRPKTTPLGMRPKRKRRLPTPQ